MGSTIELVSNSLTDLSTASQLENDREECKNISIKQKLIKAKQAITIEPVLCCYMIAYVLRDPACNNLQLEASCRVNAGFNSTVCNAVVTATHAELNFTDQNSKVQQYISDMLSWCIPIQSVVPVVLLLFAGTYSDRHGIRKPFLLIPFVGEFIGTIFSIICVIFIQAWPVEAGGTAQFVITSFFGGPPLITMAAYAYIADVTTPEIRTARIAVIQMCLSICIPIATLISGILFDSVGYVISLMIVLIIFALGFLYGIFLIKEPKPKQSDVIKVKDLLTDIVNPKHVVETFQLIAKDKGVQRSNIIFILVMIYISSTVVGGEYYVFFYFVQHAYGWSYTDYTYYYAVYSVVTSIGLAAGAFVLTKIFHLDDLLLIALSFLDKIASNIINITFKSSFGLYIGIMIGILQEVATAGIRSLSTKYVSEEDTGKTQSLIAIVEAISFAVSAQIYHQGIYAYTRDVYVQAFFYCGILLYAIGVIILMWKYLKQRDAPLRVTNKDNNGIKKHESVVE